MAQSEERDRSTNRRGPQEVSPQVLAEIGNLNLRARVLADSVLHGMHRSRNRGTSVEFAEHKEYAPGDDVRHLDWRAFARLDRDYIKRFEDESHLRAFVLVDTSGSMKYQGAAQAMSKLDFSKTCAGALSYVLARQGDAVGLGTFASELSVAVPPKARRGHLRELLSALSGLEAQGRTDLEVALDALTDALRRRSILVVFSDLLDAGERALGSLAKISARGHDVALFHVMDPDELDFPFEDTTLFTSMEDSRKVTVDARAVRSAYLEEVEALIDRTRKECRGAGIEYHKVRTDALPGRLLAQFLFQRTRTRGGAR